MISLTALATLFSAFAISVNAIVSPLEPSPGVVYRQGQMCRTNWAGDISGSYGQMSIQLMTGNNWNMVHIDTVGANLDGNRDGVLEFPCPEVAPYSAIYFFQYSAAGAPLTWTTRFTIADRDGIAATPSETTQPNGDQINWGTGKLIDASKARPPPGYLGGSPPVTETPKPPVAETPMPGGGQTTPPVACRARTRSEIRRSISHRML